MNGFIRLSFLSTIWTYVVIFLGGLVRVSGAGLGCPDWPQCFGGWIPPTSIDQLPLDMDPALFNFTLAWIEYINRVAGMLLGLLIAATAIYAIVKYRKVPKIVVPSILAAVFVAFQGWQGGQVVASELQPFLVSIHLGVALIIVSLMVFASISAFRFENRNEKPSDEASAIKWPVLGLWIAAMVQVVFGAKIRGGLELLTEKFPLEKPLELLSRIGFINDLHYLVGVILLVAAIFLGPKLLRVNSTKSPIIKQSAHGIIHIVLLQTILGAVLVIFGIPQIMQLFHLWFGALFIGVNTMLFASLLPNKEKA